LCAKIQVLGEGNGIINPADQLRKWILDAESHAKVRVHSHEGNRGAAESA
jgi:hypothetical protein